MKTGDDATKDLEGHPKQLQDKKLFGEEKKSRRESKQSSEGQQAKRMSRRLRGIVVVVPQNDTFCFSCAIGYEDYLDNIFIHEFWASCEGKGDGQPCTYWCHLRCLPQGFSTEKTDICAFVCSS